MYNIFETEQFNKITRGLKIAQCMGSNSIGDMLASKYIKHLLPQ